MRLQLQRARAPTLVWTPRWKHVAGQKQRQAQVCHPTLQEQANGMGKDTRATADAELETKATPGEPLQLERFSRVENTG